MGESMIVNTFYKCVSVLALIFLVNSQVLGEAEAPGMSKEQTEKFGEIVKSVFAKSVQSSGVPNKEVVVATLTAHDEEIRGILNEEQWQAYVSQQRDDLAATIHKMLKQHDRTKKDEERRINNRTVGKGGNRI